MTNTFPVETSGALKQPIENDKAIVVNHIVLRNVDRTMKDIQTWRNAHIAAERIIWPIRQRLYDLYKDVELDGHLSGIIEKRMSAVLNKKLYYKDASGSKIDTLDELIKTKAFRDFRKLIFTRKMWGISGAEFIPGKTFTWVEIPRKHIKPEYKIISTEQVGFDGFDYTTMPNIMVMGDTHDLGLLLKCSPYALWKRGGLADYAQFVEIFGQPVRVAKYDAYDEETKKQLYDVLENAGSSLALMIPKQADFEMMDGKTANANGDLQTQFLKALNDEMSVIVLGNTETTTSSQSSGQAQSKQHSKQQLEITKSDLEEELQYLNSPEFLSIVKSYGFAVGTGGEFCHEQEADVVELTQRIQVDSQLAKIVPIADDYFYETYEIPKPDNYEELRKKMDEQKEMELNPQHEQTEAQQQDVKKKKDKAKTDKAAAEDDDVEDLSAAEFTLWEKLRFKLSDFFAQAPRD